MRKLVRLGIVVLGIVVAGALLTPPGAAWASPQSEELAQVKQQIKSLKESLKAQRKEKKLYDEFVVSGWSNEKAFSMSEELQKTIDAMSTKLKELEELEAIYTATLNDVQSLGKFAEMERLRKENLEFGEKRFKMAHAEWERGYKLTEIRARQIWRLRSELIARGQELIASQKGGGGGCFAAGTLVLMADGSFKPIETLRAGDLVLSRSFDCGADVPARIGEVSSGVDAFVFSINEGLRPNAAHRFYTASRPKSAAELEPGDVLVGREGPAPVVSKERVGTALAERGRAVPGVTVYNILVEGTHTFYVSADGQATYLVHDQGACGR
jgi:adenylate cyclase class IV